MIDNYRQLDFFLDLFPRILRQCGVRANEAFEEICRIEHVYAFDVERINALKNAISRAYDS